MESSIRVLIVDDEGLVRTALRMFLGQASDIDVVGEAVNGVEACVLAERLSPDVVLMDVSMPRMGGVEATTAMMRMPHPPRVVAVTTFTSQDALVSMFRAGASGFLVKDTRPEGIINAVRSVTRGTFVLSPELTSEVVASFVHAAPREPQPMLVSAALTGREQDVLSLLARGMSNAEIATALHVSEATVKAHLGAIMSKWGLRDRVQVLIHGLKAGLVALD